jgi:hypothetical protein
MSRSSNPRAGQQKFFFGLRGDDGLLRLIEPRSVTASCSRIVMSGES